MNHLNTFDGTATTERERNLKFRKRIKKIKNEFLASHLGVGSHLAGFEIEKECVYVCVMCLCVIESVCVGSSK